jgi:uncharacterized protein (TIGR03435 family)
MTKRFLFARAGVAVLCGPLIVGVGRAQSPAAAAPQFEVASVKVSKSGVPAGNVQLTPGRFRGTDLALQWLILVAYKIRGFQLSGDLPGWTLSERYNVDAKTEDAGSDDRTLLMLQQLLEDRFQLRIHRETREGPVYFLTVGKNGIKMQPGICVPAVADLPNECGRFGGDGPDATLDWRGVSISAPSGVAYRSLAAQLSGNLGRPVIDKTGLTGGFDVHLRWTRDQDATADATAPSLFTAVEEQLGLKLESGKGPVEYLVVDHVEKPSGN